MQGRSATLIDHGKLNLGYLQSVSQRPEVFAPHEAPFWDDPHISRHMLAAHLDPNVDAASRRLETIDRSVAWLVSHPRLSRGHRVLDLGCGPGLYCERLCRYGLVVTGMDFSRNSVDYATASAREQGLDITYVYQNYLTLDRTAEFDAVFLIYFDFGVLSNRDRDELLTRIHRALKPGGVFVFDVRTVNRSVHRDGETEWAIHTSGFWKPGPHLVLTRYFQYPDDRADLKQMIVVDEYGNVSLYRLWDRYYSIDSITPVLEAHGFRLQDFWSDLTGTPYSPDSEALGIVARKG